MHAGCQGSLGDAAFGHGLPHLSGDQFLDGQFLGAGQQALFFEEVIEGFVAGDVALGGFACHVMSFRVKLGNGLTQARGVGGTMQEVLRFLPCGEFRQWNQYGGGFAAVAGDDHQFAVVRHPVKGVLHVFVESGF